MAKSFAFGVHEPTFWERQSKLSMTGGLDHARRGLIPMTLSTSSTCSLKRCEECGFIIQKRSDFETQGVLAREAGLLALGKPFSSRIQNKSITNPIAMAYLELKGGQLEGVVGRRHADGHVCQTSLSTLDSDADYMRCTLQPLTKVYQMHNKT